MNQLVSVTWHDNAVHVLDQRLLPHQEVVNAYTSVAGVADSIRTMQVRGAPAIGCTAAYGMALVAVHTPATTPADIMPALDAAQRVLDASRPTAVNLFWATARMMAYATRVQQLPLAEFRAAMLAEAHAVFAEDLAMCQAIGRHGEPLIPARGRVLTHCNAGGLATAGYGTALGPIYRAHEVGRAIHVYVDETRPYLQGARLTAFELQRGGVPLTLITDNMAAYFMGQGLVDCIIVGADRIAANGDVANKIGTYGLAVLAHAHGIPMYVAAPTSTIDLNISDGSMIPIEERSSDEVTTIQGIRIAPEGVTAAHPAFDVTPAKYITAIICEKGVVRAPYGPGLAAVC
ncbi:MAG: S-methyl-5-thioribose-1-phosphate isomerase [Chloroflexi bacterium]|nr:MAG: S-methyl-5-thioribose-1-phosphate isomerase [Chloroflexota bacterium]